MASLDWYYQPSTSSVSANAREEDRVAPVPTTPPIINLRHPFCIPPHLAVTVAVVVMFYQYFLPFCSPKKAEITRRYPTKLGRAVRLCTPEGWKVVSPTLLSQQSNTFTHPYHRLVLYTFYLRFLSLSGGTPNTGDTGRVLR